MEATLTSSRIVNAGYEYARKNGQNPKVALVGCREWEDFRYELANSALHYDPACGFHRDTTRIQFCGMAVIRVPVESMLEVFGDEVKLSVSGKIAPDFKNDAAGALYGGPPPTRKINVRVQQAVDPMGKLEDFPPMKVEQRTIVDEDKVHIARKWEKQYHPDLRAGLDPAFGKEETVTTWIDPESGNKIIRRGNEVMVLDEITNTKLRVENEDMLRRILESEPQPGDPEYDPALHPKEEEPEFGGETL